ncbi:MAG: NAD(P)-binding protein [Burkholderiaceae bacterium]|jgi:hypothetical protein
MKNAEIETDYLVVGAGAAGMAITDELLTHSNASITVVDRRHAPGGHWIDAYPYVRLHQPSAFYGVSSVPMGEGAIDVAGTNAGYYELAGADEIRAYYTRVMQNHFLPTGRVRYFPCSEYVGDDRFVSRLSCAPMKVHVQRRLVDTTYGEGSIPATSGPPFAVAHGVRCVPAGEIVHVADDVERFVIIGAGKTALDACVWLLERGVPPPSIRWIRPRESWWFNRRFQQPSTLLPDLYRSLALQLEVAAQARSIDEVFERLESEGVFLRIDPRVVPTMFRGALIGESELALLREIKDVVRMGHVRRIESDRIVLDDGHVSTSPRALHVHCAARGLPRRALRPIFEPGRMTVQPFLFSFSCFQFAMLGVVEATVASDAEKNRLCPPIMHWDTSADYLSAFLANLDNQVARATHPAIISWAKTTRLNALAGIGQHRNDPQVIEAGERMKRYGPPAAGNLRKLLG